MSSGTSVPSIAMRAERGLVGSMLISAAAACVAQASEEVRARPAHNGLPRGIAEAPARSAHQNATRSYHMPRAHVVGRKARSLPNRPKCQWQPGTKLIEGIAFGTDLP